MSTDTAAPATLRAPPTAPSTPSSSQTVSAPRRPPLVRRVSSAPEQQTQKWGIPLVVLIAGMFMSILDSSIVNVAISSIQNDFGGSTADVAWISTAYVLVEGVVVVASAWLGDRFGLGRVYTVSIIGFAVGSVLCGVAWSLNSLIAFRVVQAIPGGLLPAVSLAMLYKIVPPAKIGAAMGMYGLGIVVAPAIGPALGGYLVEYVNWRLVFYINVPIAALGVVAAIVALPKFGRQVSYKFDVVGFLTAAVGLAALLLAFSEGETWGWTGYRVLGLIALSLLSLATFVVVELEVEHPLLDLRVFANRAYTISLIATGVVLAGLFATLFYIPLFLQAGQGYPAFRAGLLILPQALVLATLMPIAGRLYDKVGPRWLVLGGLTIAAVGSFLLTGINPDMTRPEIVLWTCVRSCGVGLAMMPIITGGLSVLPTSQTTTGSAISTLVQRVSSALALAGLTALATTQQAGLSAARAGLVPTSATAHTSPDQLSAIWQRTQLDVLAQSYSNVFLLTGAVTLAAAALGLLLRSGPDLHGGDQSGPPA